MRALDLAVDWARTFQASLHLVHILDLNSGSRPGLEFSLIDQRYSDLIETDARLELERMAHRIQGVTTTFEVRHGRPAPQIAAFAASIGADLIVIATHGRRGFQRMLLGSTTEEVVRLAACPVITVHRPSNSVAHAPEASAEMHTP
jgi:nucleotide-binding universal stress UspA family protein